MEKQINNQNFRAVNRYYSKCLSCGQEVITTSDTLRNHLNNCQGNGKPLHTFKIEYHPDYGVVAWMYDAEGKLPSFVMLGEVLFNNKKPAFLSDAQWQEAKQIQKEQDEVPF